MRKLALKYGDIIGPLQNFMYIRDIGQYRYKNCTKRIIEVEALETHEVFTSDLATIRYGRRKHAPSISRQYADMARRKWNDGELKIIDGFHIILEHSYYKVVNNENVRFGKFKNLDTNVYFETAIKVVNSGQSLGIGYSKGEQRIVMILKELNNDMYIYMMHHTFSDCVNPKTGKRLIYDFYFPNITCCIEYDGIQHFEPFHSCTWDNKQTLQERQNNDAIKDKYCSEHGIRLVRIKYTDYDKLNSDYLRQLLIN